MSVINKKRNPRIQRLAHYLVGLIVIVKGIEKAEHFSEHPIICISLLLIGGFILYANFRHHFFEKHFKEFNVVLFLCESIVLVIVSIYYFSEGKKGLPYAYLVGAIVYFVAAIYLFRKKPWTENINEE